MSYVRNTLQIIYYSPFSYDPCGGYRDTRPAFSNGIIISMFGDGERCRPIIVPIICFGFVKSMLIVVGILM